MLQRSDVHVYLTYPFVASWSLREALACGCAVIGSEVDPVREFVTHNRNGLLTPCLDPELLTEKVLTLLDNTKLADKLRAGPGARSAKGMNEPVEASRQTNLVLGEVDSAV